VTHRERLLGTLVLIAVGVAFADSSIVVLALPELYGRFQTTIEGVAWVVTAYNAAVAGAALLLVPLIHRVRGAVLLAAGVLVFAAASVVCAAATGLGILIAARCVQGAGAAALLAASLPVLAQLAGSRARAAAAWTVAGTFGATLGPAVGGTLTQLFDWRAIFVFQVPVGAAALLAALAVRRLPERDTNVGSVAGAAVPNIVIGLLFGALVGVLFLVVLLLISGWGYSPIAGAGIASVLPVCALAARPLQRALARPLDTVAGTALLGLGLLALALLPSASAVFPLLALAVCGAGVGLAMPALSADALPSSAGLRRSAAFTVGVRHLGLVAALAAVAPLLGTDLPRAGHRAELQATSLMLDAKLGLTTKIPVAFDLGKAFDSGRGGKIPDLAEPFDAHGARDDDTLAAVRDRLGDAVRRTVARAFRRSFLFCTLLAALACALLAVRHVRGAR
jgi:predicted MFS family arabinose efflux permease